jgi:hypothetical protein
MKMRRTAKAFSESDWVTRPEGSQQDQRKSKEQLCFLKQAPHRSAVPVAAEGALGTCFVRGYLLENASWVSLLLLVRISKASHSVILEEPVGAQGLFFPVGGNPTNVCPAYGLGSKTAEPGMPIAASGPVSRRRACTFGCYDCRPILI